MTQFKEGDEVAWIVKYIKRDTTFAAIHDGVSISLETSPGSTVLVHNPQLHPAAALDVNKGLLAENERLRKELKGSNANHELYERRWYLSENEIEQLRLANSDLQMNYDYAKTECDKLQAEVLRLRGSLSFISMLTPLDGQSWESHAKFINAYAIDQLEEEE
jgi:hypothetical protein